MTKQTALAVLIAFALGAISGGWLTSHPPITGDAAEATPTERKPLFYRHPMNPAVTSPVPAKDEMGMDYVPVYPEEETSQKPPAGKKVLYYRNPMGLPDTSPVPKEDSMGMDYVPVYEDEAPPPGQVKINVEKIQKLGVKTETVALRPLNHTVRAVGTVQVDERRLYTVAPKFEGWIQTLHVNATGQTVRRGQVLMEVYSPDLLSAQQEYLIAYRGQKALQNSSAQTRTAAEQLVSSAWQRLRNWDVSDEHLRHLQQQGAPSQFVPLNSPVTGVVLEKPALQGMRFMPGDILFRIADLSTVWLIADVYEQDLALIHEGQNASLRVNAYPDKVFNGRVTFIYPTVTPETRTAKVRIELPNPGGFLKPALYGSVALSTSHHHGQVLAVPDSAVLDSGTRQVVLVQRGEGLFEPRVVKPGWRADGYVEVLEGLTAGETVVSRANFLIDAESNLKAALGSLGSDTGGGHTQQPTENASATADHSGYEHGHGGH
ncbi:efflux RND transporter periplasmic adaptor subunit [Methylocaldum sp. 14B]|uniref:efflux RND transporter periplasmic adaptor subunit n=1 Tax=Methylocaldum sp. 14B TaxID=1912213 RepID=UPI000989E972|nr:efflux RND transporter periplasmic adaptor subunit [Methylocaldum sp. 14B]